MKRNFFVVLLICIVFSVIAFMSNIFGSINPAVQKSFCLSMAALALIKVSMWVPYGILSIPSGMFLERYKVKPTLITAFAFSSVGTLLFVFFPSYRMAIASLWMVGVCITMLQVALNPLLRVTGGEEHFAFYLVVVQMVFGLGTLVGPKMYQYLISHLGGDVAKENALIKLLDWLVPPGMAWVSLFWIFAFACLIMLVLMILIRLPEVELREEERVGTVKTNLVLLKNKTVLAFFLGTFCYVGTEQGVSDWISMFLAHYHHCDPNTTGTNTVFGFWLCFTVGTILGMILLKLVDSRHVLKLFAFAAIVCLSLALFGSREIALVAFPLIGLFSSSMWCIVFSLGLNSLDKHHGTFSGILCTGIVGGALVSYVIGELGDRFGLRLGMSFLYLTLAYVLSIGFWARPLILNETVFSKRKKNIASS